MELLRGKTTLLSGNSGVGKSTLVNAIEPSATAKTGEISEAHLQGKHTTTFSHVYPLSFGGRIIDTPGIRGFGPAHMVSSVAVDTEPPILPPSHPHLESS